MLNSISLALDILVHNAGLFLPGSLLDEPDDQFLSILEVNVLSAYYLTRGLTELIKASRGAHLFFMCSTASIKAYPAGGAYAVSKHALLGLSRSLRQELMPFGVGVTSILPGPTYTSSWAGSGIPQDRFMRAEDIAELLWASAPHMAGRLIPTASAPALRPTAHALPAQSVQVWRISPAS
ncbi:MAG: SDR family oxidoreductase [Betaproteobacteria bacterium]|nr:SDR family oxidoreductase [Betaproteobacteria bacterium]